MDSLLTYSWPSKEGTSQGAGSRRPSIATLNVNSGNNSTDIRPRRKSSATNLNITGPDNRQPSAVNFTITGPDSRRPSAATLTMPGSDRRPSGMTLAEHLRRPSSATLSPTTTPSPNGIDIRRPSAIPEFGPPLSGSKPPQIHEPYFILPSPNFSLHDHLQFNPAPLGPQCNCGTWQMWCLPPHLGGCGHMSIQMQLFCGKTVDSDEPHKALAASCPGVVMRRPIKCAAYMMGLCPTCRSEAGVIQTYNRFIAPFFVPKGLTGMKLVDAEDRANAAWKGHRLAFDAWIQQLQQEGLVKDVHQDDL
ncbi:hypothetical protein M422DRAFT_45869 [Sphaerobolus stellatus SS14]|nr:hypothetical protein M422DRAFT_45869 [Sphaerobolus stellatus SS14]